jgi:acylphosphatase
MSAQRLHALVRGHVQGVGYRATTQREARTLGLAGWVRNLADGTVEVEAEGDEATIETFLEYLNEGPLGAHVDAVSVELRPAQGGLPTPFEVRRTTP